MTFTLEELGLAYRKAKVDLYYSSHASLLAIADYESKLLANLRSLLEKINGVDEEWVKDDAFLGCWTLAAKSVSDDRKKHREEHGNGLIFSSPDEEWRQVCKVLASADGYKNPKAVFRLMAKASLDFHVLSALWMLKVGHQYDDKLTECAYGNRLRRTQENRINPFSHGSFKPYLKPFRDWRDNGIKAMRAALDNKKKVVAITADVSSFYHELNPGFMLDDRFNQMLEIELSPSETKLHRLFIRALKAWAAGTPLEKGLPVGLPASAVVANLALVELDRLIEEQVAPLYYGRYVDDIMLVMENGADFGSTFELWQWLFDRSGGMLRWAEDMSEKKIQFCPDYLSDSRIQFANDKNKVFVLEGATGMTLVESIARQIHERASEWRSLPNLPRSANRVGTDLVAATQSDGELADNLRKADALSMRRAGFAIKLRDFEAYERDLPPDAWKDHRHAFFDAFIRHVLVLPCFFDLETYLPRVVKLATSCEDFKQLRDIIKALERIVAAVDECCDIGIKSCPEDSAPDRATLVKRWKTQLFNSLHQSIIAAFPPRLTKKGREAWETHLADSGLAIAMLTIKGIQAEHARWFSHDLAHMHFRFIGLPKEMVDQRGITTRKAVASIKEAAELLPSDIVAGLTMLAHWIKFSKDLPYGLAFATRPFNLAELFVLAKDPFSDASQPVLRAVVLALRGFSLNERMPRRDSSDVLQIPDDKLEARQAIAVSSWRTSLDSWVASVKRSPDPKSLDRYVRLTRLVNNVIAQPKGARYFILPELAMPAHWFMRVAQKLQGRGISLITGVEYLHASKGRVRHQVWAALTHDGLGFPSMMVYRQDKQRPALHEEQELQRLGGLKMQPDRVWRTPPVLQHGEFRFSLLVCSELTNISYRAALRGQIDALFVPEWNQDTETFNAMVESAALDIHAYIIQCNDRRYGDSRIRSPAKDSWQRDVLRVKGGTDDYCVTGEIDVQALRRFQSSHRSPAKPFKPVPDGFKIAYGRTLLPAGEQK